MPKDTADFVEVGRIPISDSTSIIVSKVIEKGTKKFLGYNINKYVDTVRYKGYTTGTMVPADEVKKFLSLIKSK
jgi:hypothetical protein